MLRAGLIAISIFALAGCENMGTGPFSAFSDNRAATRDTSSLDYHPDDQLIVSGKAFYAERAYGRAFRSFKKALDVSPNDPAALLGYAASADMLRRFDEADAAYRKLQPVIGNRIEFLNNYGYSMMLRGNLIAARKYFLAAYELDPSNEFAANNLELLRNSVNYPRRLPGDLQGL